MARNYAIGAVGVSEEAARLAPPQTFQGWKGKIEPYRVSIDEYVRFREQGYLVVRKLVDPADVEALLEHTEDLMAGRVVIPGIEPPRPDATPQERVQHYLRIHMLHRALEIHERYLLYPRILDVLEALIGPDVLALQTMLFLKGPGKPGQGYHQDSFYIPTHPDTLCGAWLAIDPADEENGCLWMTVGSQHEPVYPPADPSRGGYGERQLGDIFGVDNVSHTDETQNGLTPVARKYAREVPVILEPGDVAFFGGHILHRSLDNKSRNRLRRAFVAHYCNARSFTRWGGGNAAHILARGDTHLPFAQPRFGTPCAATLPPAEREKQAPAGSSMMGGEDGMMQLRQHERNAAG
ncbi:MAG TPA: phytanoyl-CoA dioxygenase family protein [Limnochordia bacterium]